MPGRWVGRGNVIGGESRNVEVAVKGMCGICGIVSFNDVGVERSRLESMCRAIAHRGPDARGVHVAGGVGLGQTRLAVIDLSDAAVPPLTNEDGTLWVVFNGEIYNFQALTETLKQRGHRFSTRSDTEVLLHLYEDHGIDMVHHLQGMFAFALWDQKQQCLFAARDRFGEKPFFYRYDSKSFLFGSAIRAIAAHGGISLTPDWVAIDRFLTHQYVPSPLSAFAGIAKLPPGHLLRLTGDGTLTLRRYWSPEPREPSSASAGELQEELLTRMRESVRMRMVADVPLGALLSGGIDSGTVVSLMAGLSSRPVQTFSLGFADQADGGELPFARAVAQRYGTDHHELILDSSSLALLPELVRHYNEPFADPSALPAWQISRLARERVTVALTGDGADECFAGYANYAKAMRGHWGDRLPLGVRQGVGWAMDAISARLGATPVAASLAKHAMRLSGGIPGRFLSRMAMFNPWDKNMLYGEGMRASLVGSEGVATGLPPPWEVSMEGWEWMMRHDQSNYLPDCLMVKTDVASMAHGLELRAPMLDHTLVEFAAALPIRMKHDGRLGKKIVREAVAGMLPEEVLRKPKTGFGIPLVRWLREKDGAFLREVLLTERSLSRGLFNPGHVRRMVEEQVRGRRNRGRQLWSLVILELWLREFIDH
ncbi:MAG: asparagine synthase (glutamine-hydrolyzing) [Magnetococcales bacterium]|nr:asparagine synthase (glutamine-hydrolyzing) [Magnetococcales bacterium]